MDAFKGAEALTSVYGESDLESIVKQSEVVREKERDCGACREHIIRQFSELPLPRGLQSEVDALLERLEVEE
jgi:hypothetical protein